MHFLSTSLENQGQMKQYNILFLCTHNSARSILGEALAATHPSGKFVGYSAGSTPGATVNPIAAEMTKGIGYDQSKLRSKSWDEYGLPDAPKMDFIITVCDQAAGEQCPFWPGQPVTAHWGFPDPSLVQGTDLEKRMVLLEIMNGLQKRIDLLAHMPLDKLTSSSLRAIDAKV